MENKLAKLYNKRHDLCARDGVYYWETLGGDWHGGKITELDGNDIFVDCEFCGKECCTSCNDDLLLDDLHTGHLKETSLVNLGKYAVSSLTDLHLQVRYSQEYRWALKSSTMWKSHDLLEIVFKVYSTFKKGEPLRLFASPYPQASGYYTVAVRCYKISEIISIEEWKRMTLPDKTATIELLVESADCKVYSDDPSFYYQGVWEDLYKQGLSIFKFPGPEGDGLWSARHSDTQARGVHVTKHIAQLAKEIYEYSETIAVKTRIK